MVKKPVVIGYLPDRKLNSCEILTALPCLFSFHLMSSVGETLKNVFMKRTRVDKASGVGSVYISMRA